MQASFYNNNLFRDYPFVDESTARDTSDISSIPQELVVDARLIYSDNLLNRFPLGYLIKIEKISATLARFYFRVEDIICAVTVDFSEHPQNHPNTDEVVTAIPYLLNGVSYGFYTDGSLIPQYTPLTTVIGHMTDMYGNTSPVLPNNERDFLEPETREFKSVCSDLEILIVIGNPTWLREKPIGFVIEGEVQLEPTRVIWLKNRNVRTVSVGNSNRTRSTYPKGCGNSTDGTEADLDYGDVNPHREYWTQPPYSSAEHDTIIKDTPIIFKEGFNCLISLNEETGVLRILPTLDAGMGAVSEDLSLGHYIEDGRLYSEVIPDGRYRYDGAVRIEDTLRILQNATGPDINVIPNGGIIVIAPSWASNQLNITTSNVTSEGCGDIKYLRWGSSDLEEITSEAQLQTLQNRMPVKTRRVSFTNKTTELAYLWVAYDIRLGEAAGGVIKIDGVEHSDYVKSFLTTFDQTTNRTITYVMYRTPEMVYAPDGVLQEIT